MVRRVSGRISRLRNGSKLTRAVRAHSNNFVGNERERVTAIAKDVLSKTLLSPEATLRRKFRSADRILTKKEKFSGNICIDRCNLAVALLNASGIKSWLARQIVVEQHGASFKWRVHDFVETVVGGKIHTVLFGRDLGKDYFNIVAGPANKNVKGLGSYFFRGVDSNHIGGVKDNISLKKLMERVDKKGFFDEEVNVDKKRIDLMVREKLIPKEVAAQLKHR